MGRGLNLNSSHYLQETMCCSCSIFCSDLSFNNLGYLPRIHTTLPSVNTMELWNTELMCMALSLSHSDGKKTAHGKSACNAEEPSSILETYIQSQMCWCAPVISEHIDPWGCCPAGLISSSRPMRDCIKTQGGDWRATAMAKRVLAQLSQRTQVWFLALILVILQLTVISIPEDMMLFQQSLSLSLL